MHARKLAESDRNPIEQETDPNYFYSRRRKSLPRTEIYREQGDNRSEKHSKTIRRKARKRRKLVVKGSRKVESSSSPDFWYYQLSCQNSYHWKKAGRNMDFNVRYIPKSVTNCHLE